MLRKLLDAFAELPTIHGKRDALAADAKKWAQVKEDWNFLLQLKFKMEPTKQNRTSAEEYSEDQYTALALELESAAHGVNIKHALTKVKIMDEIVASFDAVSNSVKKKKMEEKPGKAVQDYLGSDEISAIIDAELPKNIHELADLYEKTSLLLEVLYAVAPNSWAMQKKYFTDVQSLLVAKINDHFQAEALAAGLTSKSAQDKANAFLRQKNAATNAIVEKAITAPVDKKQDQRSKEVVQLQKFVGSPAIGKRITTLKSQKNYNDLTAASKTYLDKLGEKILTIAAKDQDARESYWVIPAPGKGFIEEKPLPNSAETFIADIEHNRSLKNAVDKNPSLKSAVDKYKAQTAIDTALNDKRKSIPERYKAFHQELEMRAPVLKPRSDSYGLAFLKVVGFVLGSALTIFLGTSALYNKLWRSNGEKFVNQSAEVVPASKDSKKKSPSR